MHFSNIAEDILYDLSVGINFAWKLVISKFEFLYIKLAMEKSNTITYEHFKIDELMMCKRVNIPNINMPRHVTMKEYIMNYTITAPESASPGKKHYIITTNLCYRCQIGDLC